MKNIKFHSDLNAQQFSNRVNGVTNFKNGRFEVEFLNNVNTVEYQNDISLTDDQILKAAHILFKKQNELKIFYAIKGYNQLYDCTCCYGEFKSYEEAEENLDSIYRKMYKDGKNVSILEIVKLYKRNV